MFSRFKRKGKKDSKQTKTKVEKIIERLYKRENQDKSRDFIQYDDLKTDILICGYTRNQSSYAFNMFESLITFIIQYYGYDYDTFVANCDLGWFDKYIDSDSMVKDADSVDPITQFIDPTYQIVFHVKTGFQWIESKTFLCINMMTKQVHRIELKAKNSSQIHFWLSKPLRKGDIIPDRNRRQHLFGTHINQSEAIWKRFENNLWLLFVQGRLIDNNDINNSSIWSIMHWMSLFYFRDKHCRHRGSTSMGFLFVEHDVKVAMNSKFGGNENDLSEKDKNDKTRILVYEGNKRLKCQCFLYVDWGGGYWSMGGYDRNLYRAIFEIRKINGNAQMNFTTETVISQTRRGRAMS